MFGLKHKRRERAANQPFPNEWLKILQNDVAYYKHLSEDDKKELQKHIKIFLSEKVFEGLNGLEITNNIKVIIAAQACVLLLHRETDYYPTLHTIFVYPHTFYSHIKQNLPGGIIAEGDQGRLGESWYRGPVVLSWDDVLNSAHDHNDAHNVVFHEFAHQLDGESGSNEGAPLLPKHSMYIAWARVLSEEYKNLISELEHNHKTDIDAYGATNPAEFFAVVTEAFFENPIQLKSHHPKLYEQLYLFYKQDTAKRFANSKNEND
jgi:Mlc titration factor MtfA (ptsG expression regulator)